MKDRAGVVSSWRVVVFYPGPALFLKEGVREHMSWFRKVETNRPLENRWRRRVVLVMTECSDCGQTIWPLSLVLTYEEKEGREWEVKSHICKECARLVG